MKQLLTALLLLATIDGVAQNNSNYVKENYIKIDTTITMRMA